MRSRLDGQMEQLNTELIRMGALCEEVIDLAAAALVDGSVETAEKIAPLDHEIDKKEREIEMLCMKTLLSQQPVARDLRQVSAALKMITDMERIGDQAEDIGEIIAFLNGKVTDGCGKIADMAYSVKKMVTDSVDAYVKRDLDLAKAVVAYDDVVDDYFSEVKGDLIGVIAKEPGEGEYALDLLMIAKYFERIGDHAVNIAEWVMYSVTGTHVDD